MTAAPAWPSGGLALLAATVAACSPAAPPADTLGPPPADRLTPPTPPVPALADAIERGDLDDTLLALCAAFAARGMECAEPLGLDRLAPTDVMSRYDGGEYRITMQPVPPPGAGLAYWDRWSEVLSDGAWQPRELFADDADARRVASMLLATVLAHELGHHLADLYRCTRAGAANELVADQLSVALMGELATGELAELHARTRAVADAMIAAVPAEARVEVPPGVDVGSWVADHADLPAAPRSYVSLHLSRQRALLAAGRSFAAAAETACLGPFRALLAGRRLRASSVRSERRVAGHWGAAAALDAAGRLYATPLLPDGNALVITPVDGGRAIRVPRPGFFTVTAFAAHSPTRFAVVADELLVIDASTTPPTVRAIDGAHPQALAFDRAGTLYGLRPSADDAGWDVRDLDGDRPRWHLRRERSVAWLDGPVADAELDPHRFALAGDALLAADDRSLRILDGGQVETLAGHVPGSRDGLGDRAKLFRVIAVGALPDGTIRFVEEHGDDWVVRRLAPGGRS